VAEQLEKVRRWAGVPVGVEEVPGELDRALLRAEVLAAPGASEALRRLDAVGVPMAVVSNVMNESGSVARTILDRLGVLGRFRVVVLSCEHPWAKPAPEPLRLACRFLGVSPARAVHLGDLAYDLRGAQAAGMRGWWYAGLRRYNRYLSAQVDPRKVPAGATVRSWEEVARRFLGP